MNKESAPDSGIRINPKDIISIDPVVTFKYILETMKKDKPNPVFGVAERFLQLFQDHNVMLTQIPRLIPEVTLEKLKDAESLLSVLTPDVLEKTAKLFQIKLNWLEGETKTIFNCYYCYKNPQKFFEDSKTLKIAEFERPMIAFCAVSKLNNKSGKDQKIILVQRERCAKLGEKIIYRYRICEGFLWGYWKSRIELKAVMRVWYKKYKIPVPIFQIDEKILEGIEEGYIVPEQYIRRNKRFNTDGLEDFSLSLEEDRLSKESDELPTVLEYIEDYQLEKRKKTTNSSNTLKWTQ